MAQKFGEDKALAFYDMICGLMFFNIGTGISAAALHNTEAFELSLNLKWGLFALLSVEGFGIKFWATWVVGINTYYFRDIFLGPVPSFCFRMLWCEFLLFSCTLLRFCMTT